MTFSIAALVAILAGLCVGSEIPRPWPYCRSASARQSGRAAGRALARAAAEPDGRRADEYRSAARYFAWSARFLEETHNGGRYFAVGLGIAFVGMVLAPIADALGWL